MSRSVTVKRTTSRLSRVTATGSSLTEVLRTAPLNTATRTTIKGQVISGRRTTMLELNLSVIRFVLIWLSTTVSE